MNNQVEVTGALARDFISFRQPRLKVLSQAQADAWAARLEAGYIGIGASFEAVGFADGMVRVSTVDPDTTAEDAGVKAGDRITAINGEPLKDLPIRVVRLRLSGNSGDVLVLSILRNGVKKDISVEVDMSNQTGIDVDYDENSLKRYLMTGKLSEDTPAYKGGLREGDLVVSFNGQSVQTLATSDFIDLVRNGPMGETLTFNVLRDQKPLKVEVVRGIVEAADYGAYELSRLSGGSDNDFESNHFKFKLTNLDWKRAVEMSDNAVDFAEDAPAGMLDLRGSSGNDLDAAILIAARFLNDGRVMRFNIMQGQMPVEVTYSLERFTVVKSVKGSLTTTNSQGQVITKSIDSQVEIGKVAKKYYTGKLVVLIDGKTSGAAEILASVLQTNNRALVVGRKSAGVSTLVSVRTIEGVTVQIPTTNIVEINGVPFKRVNPDYASWVEMGDREAAFNALSGRPWYWSTNLIAIAMTLVIILSATGFAYWQSRKPAKVEANIKVLPAPKPVEKPVEKAKAKPASDSSGSRFWSFAPLLMLIVMFCALPWIPKLMFGPPSGVTSKVVVELVRDDSELSAKQQKVVEQLASEYSGAIEFRILNFSDGPDVLEKSSDGFWKAGIHQLRPSTIWIRRIYYDSDGKPIEGKGSGTGMGTFTKAWLVRSIESLANESNNWPATVIKRTKPVRN
jgi:C-terminal processing protease CtpA/Prc